jgi:hypothetical protein
MRLRADGVPFHLAQAFTPGERNRATSCLFPSGPLKGAGGKKWDLGARFPGVNAWASEKERTLRFLYNLFYLSYSTGSFLTGAHQLTLSIPPQFQNLMA